MTPAFGSQMIFLIPASTGLVLINSSHTTAGGDSYIMARTVTVLPYPCPAPGLNVSRRLMHNQRLSDQHYP
jgi:hypothetical protein